MILYYNFVFWIESCFRFSEWYMPNTRSGVQISGFHRLFLYTTGCNVVNILFDCTSSGPTAIAASKCRQWKSKCCPIQIWTWRCSWLWSKLEQWLVDILHSSSGYNIFNQSCKCTFLYYVSSYSIAIFLQIYSFSKTGQSFSLVDNFRMTSSRLGFE